MAESGSRSSLGDLQLAILRVLWDRGEATAAEVHKALLDERGLALTTIATMLTKLEKKGAITHRAEGRQFVYRATVKKDQVHKTMVSELLERVFEGDALALVNHLIDAGRIEPGELSELKRRVAERAKPARGANERRA